MVGESELGNASKVKVSGSGLTEGMANEINEFIVDTREAGQYLLGFVIRKWMQNKQLVSIYWVCHYIMNEKQTAGQYLLGFASRVWNEKQTAGQYYWAL